MEQPQVNRAPYLTSVLETCNTESLRTLALLERIKASQGALAPEPWHTDMMEQFAGELRFWHGRTAFLPHDWQSLPFIAFGARALLELCVWTTYCQVSTENARTFYDDKFRDGMDLYDALGRLLSQFLGFAQLPEAPSLIAQLEKAKAALAALAASAGAAPPTENYTQVADAAKAAGLSGFYGSLNKLLSKLAHPTAMMVLSYIPRSDENALNDIATFAKVVGFMCEAEAWRDIGNCLEASLNRAEAASKR